MNNARYKIGDRVWDACYDDAKDCPLVGYFTVIKIEARKDTLGRNLGNYIYLRGKPTRKPIIKREHRVHGYATAREAVLSCIDFILYRESRTANMDYPFSMLKGETTGERIKHAKDLAKKIEKCLDLIEEAKKWEEESEAKDGEQ